MIDIETLVFNSVSSELRDTFSGISVYGEYVDSPSVFPSVTLVEDDNYIPTQNVTTQRSNDDFANVVYSVNVYSNLSTGKKSQAKAITDVVDAVMLELGFIRTMRSQVPNLDRTIYRITARYSGKVQKIVDGEDTKYVIYHK